MISSSPNEYLVEDIAAVYFSTLGFSIKRGSEIDDGGERADASQVILVGRLTAALRRLNPTLPHDVCEQVVRTLSRPPHATLVENNRWFHAQFVDGVEVDYRDDATGETRGGRAKLIDF